MRPVSFCISALSLVVVSQSAISAPTVSGNTISWPGDGWYQVQNPSANQWNVCNTKTHGNSCTVPDGTYRVNKQGGNPWDVIDTWDNLTVPSGDADGSGGDGKPTVSGNKISWPASGWYQVQRPRAENGHPQDWNICNSNGGTTSCTVPDGTYRVVKQGGTPWETIDQWDDIVVGSPTGTSGNYVERWTEDFSGPMESWKFKVVEWEKNGLDVVLQKPGICTVENGVLQLAIKAFDNERRACYLITGKSEYYGPGDNSTIKIEYRVNTSKVKAKGAWFAGWVNAYGYAGGNSTDNKKETGIEIDVFEAMPTNPDKVNIAVHDGPGMHYDWFVDANTTSDKFQTYTLEWNKNCVAIFVDGKRLRTETRQISKDIKHSILLIMEAQTGTQWGSWNVGSFADNLARDGAVGQVKWVKVSEKAGIDPNLCR